MKTTVKSLFVSLIVLAGVISCDDSDGDENSLNLSEGSIEDYSAVTSIVSDLEDIGLSGVSSDLLLGQDGISNGRTAQSCYEFSMDSNDDGTVIFSYDFGEGCELDDIVVSGKVIISLLIDEELNFEQKTTYENFTGNDWAIDGEENTSGSYTFEVDQGMFGMDITYETSRNISLVACDGGTYEISSSSTIQITNQSKTVSALQETVEGNGTRYVTSLEDELVKDLNCDPWEVYTYTQGVLKTVFNDGEFIVDYGDGTCDNLVLVTEDGIATEKEANELYEERCDEV